MWGRVAPLFLGIRSVMRRAFSGWLLPLVGALVLCCAASAYAAEAEGQPSTALFLIEVLVLVIAGRLLGELMQRLGQPSVMGHLLAGVVLGPSLFGAIWPDAQQM